MGAVKRTHRYAREAQQGRKERRRFDDKYGKGAYLRTLQERIDHNLWGGPVPYSPELYYPKNRDNGFVTLTWNGGGDDD